MPGAVAIRQKRCVSAGKAGKIGCFYGELVKFPTGIMGLNLVGCVKSMCQDDFLMVEYGVM